MKSAPLHFLPPAIAAAGLAAAVAVFAFEASSFRSAVEGWARRDLGTRTALAAATLRDALETGDFRRIHAFGEECSADGVRFTVLSGPRGVFFDSLRAGEAQPESMYSSHPCGEYTVRLGLPLERVFAPFRRARLGFLLAALAGGAGVLLVFFSTYRQRVRMRELARLERFRREFIADVSHEIKTPLTGIMGAADLLGDFDALPAESRATLVSLMKKESARLNALAQNILSLARLERAGETGALNRCAADLSGIVDDAIDRFGQRAAAAGVELRRAGETGPVVVRCDPQLVSQALANLVENAIRHSGSKDVAVSLSRAPGGAQLAVEDHGRGIPAEERERVFERFHRVDAARSADTGGSGLGLAIVRGIARLHGGDAVLSPAEPSGCRFAIFIPA